VSAPQNVETTIRARLQCVPDDDDDEDDDEKDDDSNGCEAAVAAAAADADGVLKRCLVGRALCGACRALRRSRRAAAADFWSARRRHSIDQHNFFTITSYKPLLFVNLQIQICFD